MRWQVLVGLVLCNFVWSTVPLAGKWGLEIYSPKEMGFLRYGAAFLVILALVVPAALRWPRTIAPELKETFQPKWLPWFALVGLTTFFISPLVQYWGLEKGMASANTLIVSTEPLITAIAAWIFLRERMQTVQWIGFVIAMGGFLLLSNVDPLDPVNSFALFNVANLFFLAQMPCEAIYTVVARKFASGRPSEYQLFGAAIFIGVLSLALYLLFTHHLPDLSVMTPKVLFAILWMGAVGNGICYIYWSKALQEAPVATVALTLFVQPILGTVWGQVFLKETFTFWQFTGAAFILFALALQTFPFSKRRIV